MSDVLLTAAEEAAAVARGEMPAASIWHNGYRYFPESRIRLLEQQLSTAREALEPFAAAWNVHSGKPDVLRHLTLGDLGALAAHHVSGIHFKNAAAAIRSLGEPGAHPPGK